jgi:hypothetical protein
VAARPIIMNTAPSRCIGTAATDYYFVAGFVPSSTLCGSHQAAFGRAAAVGGRVRRATTQLQSLRTKRSNPESHTWQTLHSHIDSLHTFFVNPLPSKEHIRAVCVSSRFVKGESDGVSRRRCNAPANDKNNTCHASVIIASVIVPGTVLVCILRFFIDVARIF